MAADKIDIGSSFYGQGYEQLSVSDSEKLKATPLVGVYFSAHWCGPCRSFTPQLAEFYNKAKVSHPGQFEVVFASSDSSEEEFKSYFATMPWKSFKFDDARIKAIKGQLQVGGIPTLTVIRPDGTVVVVEGDAEISEGVDACIAQWSQ